MNYIIAILYIIIAIIFSTNLGILVDKLRNGSKKVSYLSLLATSSLIVNFFCLGFYFLSQNLLFVIVSQIYLLICMVYIKLIKHKD
jgi:hypothetical protein